MHRLRKGKKDKEDGEHETKGGGLLAFIKGKNIPAPVAPAIDLTTVLPPTDDFRTSLLLPNLAQRFSILANEQGELKPSTTSSIVNELSSHNFPSFSNNGGLSDIAETSSLSGSISGKQGAGRDSHTSEESGSGGMMNRPKPGEGNILFGGRQKIYRVATSHGSQDDAREPGSLAGRIYYDNDIPVSAFSWREKKKTNDGYDGGKVDDLEEPQQERSTSPGRINNNRNTSSSTNSTPLTRSSTAATSVNSQHPSSPHIGSPPNTMVTGKPRRQPLYEQALDQKLQEQQTKMEMLTNQLRIGTMSPTQLNKNSPIDTQRAGAISPTTERHNFYDNSHNKPTPIATPVGGFSTFNFGLDTKPGDNTGSSEKVGGYDDERYHLMQQHKLLVREKSPVRAPGSPIQHTSPVQEDIEEDFSLKTSSISSMETDEHEGLDWGKLYMDSTDDHEADPHNAEQSHQEFLSTPSSGESSEYEYDDNDDGFEHARDSETGIGLGLQRAQVQKEIAPLRSPKGISPPSTSGSEHQSTASIIDHGKPGVGVHKLEGQPSHFTNDQRPLSPISPRLTAKDQDSPTLPPVQGLSVLVRKHLRSNSGRSSIYDDSTRSQMPPHDFSDHTSPVAFKPGANGLGKVSGSSNRAVPSGASGSSGGNLWEFDDWDCGYYEENHGTSDSPTSATHPALRRHSGVNMKNTGIKEEVTEGSIGRNNLPDEDNWLRAKDQISDQSETHSSDDDESRDWEDELAHRKALVQQNLREHASRSSSPVPELRDAHPSSPSNLEFLKRKISNSRLNQESGNNAIRMFGVGADKHHGLREEEERLRETVRGVKNYPIRGPHGPYPQDREFRQGPPLHNGHPGQRPPNMPLNMGNRPPPHLDDHPAMRPRQFPGRGPPPHGPPYDGANRPLYGPYGPPPTGRPPMRGPSLRSQPSREGYREGEHPPRMITSPRSGDPRWRDDRQFDGHPGVPRPAMPSSNVPGPYGPPYGSPRMGIAPRVGPHPADENRDLAMDRRPGGPAGALVGWPMNGTMSRGPDGREGRPIMGRGPPLPDDPRMLKRGPSNRIGPHNDIREHDMRGRNPHDMSPYRQSPYSPEQSPPPSQMRSRGNSNAQSPSYQSPILTRQRSESAVRRQGPVLAPLQTSPPRGSPALTNGIDRSPAIGISPVPPPSASTPALPSMPTPVSSSGKTTGFHNSSNLLPNSVPPTPSSAGPAATAYAKMQSFQQSAGPAAKKRVVDKAKISEPTLIASTSNIATVPLQPQSGTGSSEQRKRRQTATMFGGKIPSDGEIEKSSFQMDEHKKDKPRGKLRKSTSDGGGLRARREAERNAPATPQIPMVIRDGGMI